MKLVKSCKCKSSCKCKIKAKGEPAVTFPKPSKEPAKRGRKPGKGMKSGAMVKGQPRKRKSVNQTKPCKCKSSCKCKNKAKGKSTTFPKPSKEPVKRGRKPRKGVNNGASVKVQSRKNKDKSTKLAKPCKFKNKAKTEVRATSPEPSKGIAKSGTKSGGGSKSGTLVKVQSRKRKAVEPIEIIDRSCKRMASLNASAILAASYLPDPFITKRTSTKTTKRSTRSASRSNSSHEATTSVEIRETSMKSISVEVTPRGSGKRETIEMIKQVRRVSGKRVGAIEVVEEEKKDVVVEKEVTSVVSRGVRVEPYRMWEMGYPYSAFTVPALGYQENYGVYESSSNCTPLRSSIQAPIHPIYPPVHSTIQNDYVGYSLHKPIATHPIDGHSLDTHTVNTTPMNPSMNVHSVSGNPLNSCCTWKDCILSYPSLYSIPSHWVGTYPLGQTMVTNIGNTGPNIGSNMNASMNPNTGPGTNIGLNVGSNMAQKIATSFPSIGQNDSMINSNLEPNLRLNVQNITNSGLGLNSNMVPIMSSSIGQNVTNSIGSSIFSTISRNVPGNICSNITGAMAIGINGLTPNGLTSHGLNNNVALHPLLGGIGTIRSMVHGNSAVQINPLQFSHANQVQINQASPMTGITGSSLPILTGGILQGNQVHQINPMHQLNPLQSVNPIHSISQLHQSNQMNQLHQSNQMNPLIPTNQIHPSNSMNQTNPSQTNQSNQINQPNQMSRVNSSNPVNLAKQNNSVGQNLLQSNQLSQSNQENVATACAPSHRSSKSVQCTPINENLEGDICDLRVSYMFEIPNKRRRFDLGLDLDKSLVKDVNLGKKINKSIDKTMNKTIDYKIIDKVIGKVIDHGISRPKEQGCVKKTTIEIIRCNPENLSNGTTFPDREENGRKRSSMILSDESKRKKEEKDEREKIRLRDSYLGGKCVFVEKEMKKKGKSLSEFKGKKRHSHGWCWKGKPERKAVYVRADDGPQMRDCYPSMCHIQGDVIEVGDCILLRSGPKKTDLDFVAKICALWEAPDTGEMMMSLLWYYRPHVEDGNKDSKLGHSDEIYASKHRDVNSVACVDDKCWVLTFNEYCRWRKLMKAHSIGLSSIIGKSIVPKGEEYSRKNRLPGPGVSGDRVWWCGKVYDFRLKRTLKNPG